MAKELTEEEKKAWGIIVWVLLIPSILLRAWALAKLWLWFVVPLGVQPIGRAHAYGLAALLFFAIIQPNMEDHPHPDRRAVALIIWPLIAVGSGWICKGIMVGF